MKAKDLRNSIFQQAMEGKLVSQDPTDEPSSILLDNINKEKERLIREGEIKRNNKETIIFKKENHYYEKIGKKGEPVCIDDKIPFSIPDNWVWVNFENICSYIQKGKSPKYSDVEIHPVLGQKCIQWDGVKIEYARFITPESFETYGEIRYLKDGDLLLNCLGHGTLGRIAIFDSLLSNKIIVADSRIMVIRPFKDFVLPEFLYYFWASPYVQQVIDSQSEGSTNQKMLNLKLIKSYYIPLPPLNEQKRIVAKIQEVLSLIDEYGDYEEKLTQLNFEFPDKLKSSILYEAVQGKLIPQDLNDEHTSILLDNIKKEKEKLIKAKKIKRNNKESFIFKENDHYYEKIGKNGEPICIDEELPFDIPDTWEWCRLNSICEYIQRGKSPKYSQIKKYPVISQKCNQWEGLYLEEAKFIDPDSLDSYKEERILQDEDLLWNSTGTGTLGRIGLYDASINNYDWAVADGHITVVRPFKKWVMPKFIYYYLANPTVQFVIESEASGSTNQIELNLSTVKNYLIPLPPTNEQKRIINKIEVLFDAIDVSIFRD